MSVVTVAIRRGGLRVLDFPHHATIAVRQRLFTPVKETLVHPRARTLLVLCALSAIVAIPSTASAQRTSAPAASPPAVPQFIVRGLEQMRGDSAAAAIATWTAAWKAPADAAKASGLLASLQQIREMGGAPVGYDIVGTEAVGLHLRRVYALLRYDSQPLFVQFVAYSPSERPAESDWKLATVSWNTTVAEVWPPSIWSR